MGFDSPCRLVFVGSLAVVGAVFGFGSRLVVVGVKCLASSSSDRVLFGVVCGSAVLVLLAIELIEIKELDVALHCPNDCLLANPPPLFPPVVCPAAHPYSSAILKPFAGLSQYAWKPWQ